MMDSITLSNFRCFRDKQTARLAPLTLLVGENSTGKTSFLALIRALWDIAYEQRVPDFKEVPYDLGSFLEIAHHNDGHTTPNSFMAGFGYSCQHEEPDSNHPPHYFETSFEKSVTWAIPSRRCYSQGETFVEELYDQGRVTAIRLGTTRGTWQRNLANNNGLTSVRGVLNLERDLLPIVYHLVPFLQHLVPFEQEGLFQKSLPEPLADSPAFAKQDAEAIGGLISSQPLHWRRAFAGAPVRSKPRRTYDAAKPTPDPEGDYIPTYLASLYSQDRDAWKTLRMKLELFGKESGLFDRLLIEQLEKRDGGAFQIRIQGSGAEMKGPHRNLIDVGYGVSQALPLITEMLQEDAPELFLLQQPEVHLHPSAQAALGSLFCEVVGHDRQLIVETHSDYILDRIRMDVRDGKSSLTPDDVSILFFQRKKDDVLIHSLRFDDNGNVLGGPQDYRDFFMRETRRSLGL